MKEFDTLFDDDSPNEGLQFKQDNSYIKQQAVNGSVN